MNPGRYRTRRLIDATRSLLLPIALLTFILRIAGIRLGNPSVPCYALFIVACAIAKNYHSNHVQAKEARKLGAKPIPRVVGRWPGNIDVLLRIVRSAHTDYVQDVYLELFREYKCTTLNTRIFWIDQIITMDAEHCKFILSTGFDHFWRGEAQKERMETFLGAGIFNRDDQQWKMHRAIARPFFARERISDFDLFEKYASLTLFILSAHASSSAPLDVQDLYSRFTLDAASAFLFGHNMDTLGASLPLAGSTPMGSKGSATSDSWGSFAQAFEAVQQVTTARARLGYFWSLFELGGDKAKQHVKVIRRWLDPMVKQAMEDKKRMSGLISPVNEKTFLQHLTESTDDAELICDQLLNILLASRDTTACLLTYVTYLIALNPAVTEKLRAEVLARCGPLGIPTCEDIRQMKYIRAVLNETLRLFPPVPLNIRETRAAGCAIPFTDSTYSSPIPSTPLYMPPSTTTVFFPLLTQRNQALWGDDADEFDPERWIDPERLAKYTANPAMFSPFGAGPRICLGQNYAYNEASYFLVRLLQRFDTFELAPEAQPAGSLPPPEWRSGEGKGGRKAVERLWPGAALTLYVKGGMWIRIGNAMTS